jgi:hypothetical protein
MAEMGTTEAAGGPARRRILFFAENAQSWNTMLPIVMNLRQRPPHGVDCPCGMLHGDGQSWRVVFLSKASAEIIRQHFVPGEEVGVQTGDIFIVTHIPRFADNLPQLHVVSLPHGSGFGNSGPYSLKRYSQSTLHCANIINII